MDQVYSYRHADTRVVLFAEEQQLYAAVFNGVIQETRREPLSASLPQPAALYLRACKQITARYADIRQMHDPVDDTGKACPVFKECFRRICADVRSSDARTEVNKAGCPPVEQPALG